MPNAARNLPKAPSPLTELGQARATALEEASFSIDRLQRFDPETLARTGELGAQLDFSAAVPFAGRLVELFRQVSLDILDELSVERLVQLKRIADTEFNLLQQIIRFDVDVSNPRSSRDDLVEQVERAYEDAFEIVWPAIAYSIRNVTDLAKLEREARAAVQSIEDRTRELEQALAARKEDADSILAEIRKTAAEQGVSQQARYFKDEAELHEQGARTWMIWTIVLTAGVAIIAVASLFLHKIPGLNPDKPYEAAQLLFSKLLVFGTLASFLVLASRNYLAHRHNHVVNKHRQNSLVTYKALVEAAGDQANRDVVLSKVADSIFGSQSTGFTKDAADAGPRSNISLNPSVLKAPTGS